jgi:hypothetical protein
MSLFRVGRRKVSIDRIGLAASSKLIVDFQFGAPRLEQGQAAAAVIGSRIGLSDEQCTI